MHGRLKLKTSAEQEAEKKKERAIKQKKYLAGLNEVFSKRKEEIHNQDTLNVAAQLLAVNPDTLTLWNYKRELLLWLKGEQSEEEWQKCLEEELKTTEQCLIKNPKSYGAWHHRDWIFGVIPEPPYQEELELCEKYLQLDERNFHCWDHRRLIVSLSGGQLSEELDLTTSLINKNFSNFSAWHYRSNLLSSIQPRPEDGLHPIPEDVFLLELQKVSAAVFTDPSDQSPWFYLRWLLKQKKEEERIVQIGLMESDMKEYTLVLVFNQEVLSCGGVCVYVDEEEVSALELNPHSNKCIWFLPIHLEGLKSEIRVTLPSCRSGINLATDLSKLPYFKCVSDLSKRTTFSNASKKALNEIMENCVTLNHLDPGNKWVLLTLVNIMSFLDAPMHEQSIVRYLNELENLDPLRGNYYKDLRSKIVWKNLVSLLHLNLDSFIASNLGLTRIISPHYLCSFSRIDLGGNCLRSLTASVCFLNCIQLILDETPVQDLSPVSHLHRLKELSLKSCTIRFFSTLEALRRNHLLAKLCLEDNAIIEEEDFEAKIKVLFPTLNELTF